MIKHIVTSLLLLPTSLLANTDVISVTDFGADGTDALPDHIAFQNAINAAIKNHKSLYVPSGQYIINNTLTTSVNSWPIPNNIKIYGEKRELTTLTTSSDISVFNFNKVIDISNLTIKQTSSNRIGKAIEIPNGASYSNFSTLTISGFDKGIYGRYMVWDRFQDIIIHDSNVGIEFTEELQNGNELTGGWNNWTTGWFNNVLSFDNIVIDQGTKIGFKIAGMGVNIENSTVQGGAEIGVWLYGPSKDKLTWNNSINNFYAEGVDTVFKFENARYVGIDGLFTQGGASNNRYNAVIDAKNVSLVDVKGATGQDWWHYSAKLDNSKLVGDLPAIGGSVYIAQNDTVSRHFPSLKFNTYNINGLPANRTWKDLCSFNELSPGHVYRLTISGIRDGYSPVLEEYLIYKFSNGLYKINSVAGESRVKIQVANGQIQTMLNYSGGNGISSSKVTVQQVR
jgi:hypothetical protein